ncbi:MAG: hypothetical protein U0524_03935 [Candidatus Saccharimonadales bacterium]
MPEGNPENHISVNQFSEEKWEAMKQVVEELGTQLGPVRMVGDRSIQPGQTFESYTKRGEEYTMPKHVSVLKPDHVVVEMTTPVEASLTRDRIRRLSAEILKGKTMPVSYAYSQAPVTPTIAPVTPVQAQPRAEAPRPAPAAPTPRPMPKPARQQKRRGLFSGLTGGSGSTSSLQSNGGDKWDRSG